MDPFLEMFEFNFNDLGLQDFSPPLSEPGVQSALRSYWQSFLDHLQRPGGSGVYIYGYNPLLGLEQNAAQFASRMQQTFNWGLRDTPLVVVANSSGGLLATLTFDSAFGLGNPLPGHLRLLTTGTPFRGTPLANQEFRSHVEANALQPIYAAARPLWLEKNFSGQRRNPPEVLGSIVASASFFNATTESATDLDLDAHWLTVRQSGLDYALFPSCAEMTDDQHSHSYRRLSQLRADFRDSFDRQPYARSDGIVPVASALNRRDPFDDVWFSVETRPPEHREIHFPGLDHTTVRASSLVSEATGLGSGEHVNSTNLRVVHVPFGSFEIGSDGKDAYHVSDEIQHRVNLTHGFFMGHKR
jgi:hypothetical protein